MKQWFTLTAAGVLALWALSVVPAVGEERYTYGNHLTGDWAGMRTRFYDRGVDLGVNYTAEPAASVSGGWQDGSTYTHNIDVALTLDADKLIGLNNTTFLAKYSSRVGDNLSETDVVPASTPDGRYVYGAYYNKSQEAYGGQTTKLVNFQLTTRLTPAWRIDYGRLVMNDLFLRSDLYCNFTNNAICGSPKGVFTPYALNAYPDATMGVSVRYRATEMLDLKCGVFDGGWTKQNTNGWDWTLGENGTAMAGEVDVYFDRAEQGGAARVIKVGANHHTGDFDNFKTGGQSTGQTSLYALTDWWITRETAHPDQGLSMFGAAVWNTSDEIAALPALYQLGLVYQGLLPARDHDKLGLMASLAKHSVYNTYTHDFISGKIRSEETILEMTYNFVFRYGIQIMPGIQYIIHPNGSADFSNATVLGLKFSVTL